MPLARLPNISNQIFKIHVRKNKTAKCAICKKNLTQGDLQASTEGHACRTISRVWILRTFYFCPSMTCITKLPRNSVVTPFCPSEMTLQGVKLTFFSDSHLAPKFFKVVANSKKLVAIFKDKQNLSLRCQRSR